MSLCLDELHHKDMEYQLKITHVEYVNRDTRSIKLPNYDLKAHPEVRKRKKFWIAYAGSDIRVMHEDFFTKHYIDEPKQERLFRNSWVKTTMQQHENEKQALTINQKQNIIKMAFATGSHPNDRIAYIKRDVDDDKFVWKGKTEAGIEVNLEDEWVKLNIMNPHCQWYNRKLAHQLIDENIDNPEKHSWVQLPVGDFLVIKNENEVSISRKKAKIELDVTKPDLYKFQYHQKEFGDVCTLINVINILDYMNQSTTVATLVPYMNQDYWHEYQNKHAPTKKHGYEISQVMQLLRRQCKYSHQKVKTDSLMTMNKKFSFVLMTSPTHAIGVFDNLIFDANYSTVKKLTLNNLKTYDLEQINTVLEKNGKITCWVFYRGHIPKMN